MKPTSSLAKAIVTMAILAATFQLPLAFCASNQGHAGADPGKIESLMRNTPDHILVVTLPTTPEPEVRELLRLALLYVGKAAKINFGDEKLLSPLRLILSSLVPQASWSEENVPRMASDRRMLASLFGVWKDSRNPLQQFADGYKGNKPMSGVSHTLLLPADKPRELAAAVLAYVKDALEAIRGKTLVPLTLPPSMVQAGATGLACIDHETVDLWLVLPARDHVRVEILFDNRATSERQRHKLVYLWLKRVRNKSQVGLARTAPLLLAADRSALASVYLRFDPLRHVLTRMGIMHILRLKRYVDPEDEGLLLAGGLSGTIQAQWLFAEPHREVFDVGVAIFRTPSGGFESRAIATLLPHAAEVIRAGAAGGVRFKRKKSDDAIFSWSFGFKRVLAKIHLAPYIGDVTPGYLANVLKETSESADFLMAIYSPVTYTMLAKGEMFDTLATRCGMMGGFFAGKPAALGGKEPSFAVAVSNCSGTVMRTARGLFRNLDLRIDWPRGVCVIHSGAVPELEKSPGGNGRLEVLSVRRMPEGRREEKGAFESHFAEWGLASSTWIQDGLLIARVVLERGKATGTAVPVKIAPTAPPRPRTGNGRADECRADLYKWTSRTLRALASVSRDKKVQLWELGTRDLDPMLECMRKNGAAAEAKVTSEALAELASIILKNHR